MVSSNPYGENRLSPEEYQSVLTLHNNLSASRAAELDKQMQVYAQKMSDVLKTNPSSTWGWQAIGASPNSDIALSVAPDEYKQAQLDFTKSYLERYGEKKGGLMRSLMAIATFATIATGMGTLAAGVNSGTLFAGFDPLSGGEGVDVLSEGSSVGDAFSVGSAVKKGVDLAGKATDIVGKVGDILDPILGGGLADATSTWFQAIVANEKSKQDEADYKAQAQNYDFLARQSGLNKQIQLSNFVYEQQRTITAQNALRRKNTQTVGAQRAAYGAAGVTMDGSAQDVLLDTATQGELDVALENFESNQRQRNYLVAASAAEAEQKMNVLNSKTATKNAANAVEAGNKMSDFLKASAVAKGVSSIPGIIKGVKAGTDLVKSII